MRTDIILFKNLYRHWKYEIHENFRDKELLQNINGYLLFNVLSYTLYNSYANCICSHILYFQSRVSPSNFPK